MDFGLIVAFPDRNEFIKAAFKNCNQPGTKEEKIKNRNRIQESEMANNEKLATIKK